MDNLFYKTDRNIKKITAGKYSFMGGSFFAAAVPDKMSFFARRRLKKRLMPFSGALSYSQSGIIPYIKTRQTDGSICICENIEMLCRKLCKNNGIPMPPSVSLYDRIFTDAGAQVLRCLGRICSEIYIVTKSRAAHGYADYMLDEYGCVVSVSDSAPETDIIIAAERLEKQCNGIVIDLFGENMHIKDRRVSELFFEYRGISDEDKKMLGEVCTSRMYDFLKLSGINIGQNVNFIGYG